MRNLVKFCDFLVIFDCATANFVPLSRGQSDSPEGHRDHRDEAGSLSPVDCLILPNIPFVPDFYITKNLNTFFFNTPGLTFLINELTVLINGPCKICGRQSVKKTE